MRFYDRINDLIEDFRCEYFAYPFSWLKLVRIRRHRVLAFVNQEIVMLNIRIKYHKDTVFLRLLRAQLQEAINIHNEYKYFWMAKK